MGDKNKMPEDMELFRRKMGDVRPLKVEKRVPPQKPRSVKTKDSTVRKPAASVAQNSGQLDKCIASPNKRTYQTLADATSAAEFAKQDRLAQVRPYLCHACGKFHLTSKQPI